MQELQGDFEQSLKTLQIVLDRFPNHAPAHYAKASLLLQTERVEEACEYYRTALSLNPAFAEAACDLGQALIRLGQVDESLKWYREGHRLGTQRSDWRHPSAEWLEICERVKADIDWLQEHGDELSEWQFDAARAVDLAINSCFPTKNWEAGVRLIARFSHDNEVLQQLSADSLRRLAVIVAQYLVARQNGSVIGDWPDGRLIELTCKLLEESAARFASELASMPEVHHEVVKNRFASFFQNQTDARIFREERFLTKLSEQQVKAVAAVCGEARQNSEPKNPR
jgi:tetratricopeptide (TPR) repeat protein